MCPGEALEQGWLTPADAGKLAGALSWGASQVFGRGAACAGWEPWHRRVAAQRVQARESTSPLSSGMLMGARPGSAAGCAGHSCGGCDTLLVPLFDTCLSPRRQSFSPALPCSAPLHPSRAGASEGAPAHVRDLGRRYGVGSCVTLGPSVGRGAGPSVHETLGSAAQNPGMFWPPSGIAVRGVAARSGRHVGASGRFRGAARRHAGPVGPGGASLPRTAPSQSSCNAFYPQVICFIDSNVALGTLLRGSSRLGWRAVAVPRAHLSCAGNPIGTG